METKTHVPSFTVSLRGYDREEVDEYLDSLAEALSQVEDAEAHARQLQSHVAKCNARIKELEDRVRSETPKNGTALGERIGLLLHEAEEAAADAVARAEAEASIIVARAETRSAEADELLRNATTRAEEQARRIETVARGEAAEIVAEAEGRAAARTRQIEQWAEQVVSHTRSEEARLFLEQQRAKEAADVELKALAEQRAAATTTLTELREALGRAVGIIAEPEAEPVTEPESGRPTEAYDVMADGPVTGETPTLGHAAADMPEAEQFEAKLDAWVAGASEEE